MDTLQIICLVIICLAVAFIIGYNIFKLIQKHKAEKMLAVLAKQQSVDDNDTDNPVPVSFNDLVDSFLNQTLKK